MTSSCIMSNAGGFTLVELLTVIVIVAIAGALALSVVGSNNDLQVQAAARDLVSTLLYAQTLAITSHQPMQVQFDTAQHSVVLLDQNDQTIIHPVTQQPYQISYPDSDTYHNVRYDAVDFDGTERLWFDRLGAPYSGSMSLQQTLSAGEILIRAGTATLTVRVHPLTGNITIDE